MSGSGLNGYFGEQGSLVGIQECLERFHQGCVDYVFFNVGFAISFKIKGKCKSYRSLHLIR